MKKYAIICLLLFHALQIEAQPIGVEITHILSSDSIDNGRPCKPYNLFPFYKNNRDSCLLCVCNKYINNCKYYRYLSKENYVVIIDTIAKHHSDKYTDSLYSLTMSCLFPQRDSIIAKEASGDSQFVFTIKKSMYLLKQGIQFSVNENGAIAYKDEMDNCITIWNRTSNLPIGDSKNVDEFTWITDTTLIFSIPHLEDEHGTISYTLFVYDVFHHTCFPVIASKMFDFYDYYNDNVFYLNTDLQLCKAALQKNETNYSLDSIEILTLNKLYNMGIYGLFKLPTEKQFLMIGYDDYYLFQIGNY